MQHIVKSFGKMVAIRKFIGSQTSLFKIDYLKSTDSIMALYKGTGGQQPQMFGVPGGMYVFPQQNAQPQQQQMITNSYGTMASGFQQQAVPGGIPQYAVNQQAPQVLHICFSIYTVL